MPKPRINREREHRIAMEIVVDAYNEEERAMAWCYYLTEQLTFPFEALIKPWLLHRCGLVKLLRSPG